MARWAHILDKERLIDHGSVHLRAAALDIIEHAIRAADPYAAALRLISLDSDLLRVGELEFNLRDWEHIYVIGAGKATHSIAEALEEILGDRITAGAITIKQGETSRLKRIRATIAAHPIPDEASVSGAHEIINLARQAGPRDIVFSTFTGGSSSLFVLPENRISLADKRLLNKLLLECGASIREMNAVRKHISRVKGGRLGLQIFPAALINLTVSDVVGDPLDYITDPTVPDTSTYEDAWCTLDKYQLWERIPGSIRAHLRLGPEIETPKSYTYPCHSFILIASDAACQGAADRCRQLGFGPHILTTSMEGESREAAQRFVEAASQIMDALPRDQAGCAVLASGETVVTIHEPSGEGGPSQEFAAAATLELSGHPDVVLASFATDGTDGPGNAGGGLVDGHTADRVRQCGLDPAVLLDTHSARTLLEASGDLLITGPTGTNVNDVALLLASHVTSINQS